MAIGNTTNYPVAPRGNPNLGGMPGSDLTQQTNNAGNTSGGLGSTNNQQSSGGIDFGSILPSLLGPQPIDPALLNYLNNYTNWYEGTQWPQLFGLQAGQLSGYYNSQPTQTMQQQLWQEQQTAQQNYLNNLLGLGNATGMVGNQPTLQFQDLMNQAALQQENMGLQGRGQDLQALLGQEGYANNLQNILGQYGTALGQQGVDLKNIEAQYGLGTQQNQDQLANILANAGINLKGTEAQYGLGQQQNQAQLAAALANAGINLKGIESQYGLGQQQNLGQYGLGLANVGEQQLGLAAQYGLGQQQGLGQYGAALGNQAQQALQTQANYDIAQQQLQAQMAQSPLVAWYTARGLPPPQQAILSSQNNPDFSNTLGQQQSSITQALLNPNNPNFNVNPYGSSVGQVSQQLFNPNNPNFNQLAFGGQAAQAAGQAINPNNPDFSQIVFGNQLGQAANQVLNPRSPNFNETATSGQQGRFSNALLGQAGAPKNFQLNPMQQATMNWSQQPTNVVAQTPYNPPSPQDATNLWGTLIRNMQSSGNVHLYPGRWVDMANQAGIPPNVAQTMWNLAAQQGMVPTSTPELFRSLLVQAAQINNNTPGGPMGAVQIGNNLPGTALPPSPTGFQLGQAV